MTQENALLDSRHFLVSLSEEKLLRRLRQLKRLQPNQFVVIYLSPLKLITMDNEEILETIDKPAESI